MVTHKGADKGMPCEAREDDAAIVCGDAAAVSGPALNLQLRGQLRLLVRVHLHAEPDNSSFSTQLQRSPCDLRGTKTRDNASGFS